MEEALEKAIRKWESVSKGGLDLGRENCALCEIYFKERIINPCKGCPVRKKSHFNLCRLTPYIDWLQHHLQHQSKLFKVEPPLKIECEKCRKLAEKELEYLKSLRN